jgi:hypothetical protein
MAPGGAAPDRGLAFDEAAAPTCTAPAPNRASTGCRCTTAAAGRAESRPTGGGQRRESAHGRRAARRFDASPGGRGRDARRRPGPRSGAGRTRPGDGPQRPAGAGRSREEPVAPAARSGRTRGLARGPPAPRGLTLRRGRGPSPPSAAPGSTATCYKYLMDAVIPCSGRSCAGPAPTAPPPGKVRPGRDRRPPAGSPTAAGEPERRRLRQAAARGDSEEALAYLAGAGAG